MKSGTADLPLHGGHVPAWLADRMTELGMTIAEQVVLITGEPSSSRDCLIGTRSDSKLHAYDKDTGKRSRQELLFRFCP
jgi:hypothetical protein